MHKALDYRGRCVVITGAAGGIGRGLAQSFAAAGATLELLDRDADALARLADELAGTAPHWTWAIGRQCSSTPMTSLAAASTPMC